MSYGAPPPPRMARRLYLGIAVPRFTYAVDVWVTPIIPAAESGKRSTGNTGRHALHTTWSPRCLLVPTSGPVPPERGLPAGSHTLSHRPKDHPLRNEVNRAMARRRQHVPPLERVLRCAKIIPYELERWSFKHNSLPFLSVPPPPQFFLTSRDALMAYETDHSRVMVFADGARNSHGVGAGAVLTIHGRVKAQAGVLLGDRDRCTILEAELAAILIATEVIWRLRVTEAATIYSDSQLAFACIQGAAHAAPRSLLKAIEKGLKRIRAREDCTRLSTKWCPAHRGVRGNQLVDREAKLASKGEEYPRDLIPAILVNY
ncbi:hypothetical protein FRC08_009475 [Ceratobasidium sp. 394]|nr:hypothetical protein FRC08_009475 [Ceratobasidium sp. 394]